MTVADGVAVVPFDCDSCPPGATATVYESIVDGRLRWSRFHACPGGPIQECGRDEPPPGVRQALLEQCGVFHLRLWRVDSRVGVMKALREHGTALADIPTTLAALTDQGLPGTEMELRLLAVRLDRAGATMITAAAPAQAPRPATARMGCGRPGNAADG